MHGRAHARVDVNARAKGTGSGQAKVQPTPTTPPIKSPPRSPAIKRAKRPPIFVGVRPVKRAPILRAPGKQPTTTPASTTPPTPPPPAPVPPPEEPPENPFGYEQPVLGCIEGNVYFVEENTQNLPTDYTGLQSSAVLYACEWDIPTRAWEAGFPGVEDRFEWFAIRYTGAFRIAAAGRYAFRISSDDGSKLAIDGHPVVANDGLHPPQVATGEIDLTAGDHTITLEYMQGPRFHINLQVFVTPPGGSEGLFSVRGE